MIKKNKGGSVHMALRIVLLVFAYLLLGAHFLRIGNLVLRVFCVLSPFLLFIRKRYIYPRLGYAKVRKEKNKALKLIISILVLIVFVFVLKVSAYNWILPFYLALVFGAMAFVIAYLYRTVVEYFLGGVILLSGIIGLVATMQGNAPGIVTALQLCFIGVIFVLVGSIQCIRFMRSHAIAKEQVNENIG